MRGPSTRNARKLLAGLSKAERALAQVLGERSKPEALASALGVSAHEVEEMRAVLGGRDVPCGVEIQGRAFEAPSQCPSPESLVADAEERQAEIDRLERALQQLDPRARRVLERRHLTQNAATFAVLATEMGLSRERVRQIECQAKARVRELCACA